MFTRKSTPKLHPYSRTKNTRELIRFSLVLIVLIIAVGWFPLLSIITSCCMPGVEIISSPSTTWQKDTIVFAAAILIAFLWQNVAILIEKSEGKWLTTAYLYDHSARAQAVETGATIGIIIVAILFLLFPTSIGQFAILGLLTGFFMAVFLNSSLAVFADLQPQKNFGDIVTQQSMQKYLEDEYGDDMEHLLAEARKTPNRWRARVRTQEGLEAWAAETYQRLGDPPHMSWDNIFNSP